jgi:hypothetical protein
VKIVAGIDIDRVYHKEEIIEMYKSGKLKDVTLVGYVSQANDDGTCQFVPWYKSERVLAKLQGVPFGKAVYTSEQDVFGDMRKNVEEQHPIVRRTPEQRVAAMMGRMLADAQRTGTIPGLSDEKIREITGEYWKTGVSTVTQDMVRKVAAHYLGLGEATNKEADRHRSTRAHAKA